MKILFTKISQLTHSNFAQNPLFDTTTVDIDVEYMQQPHIQLYLISGPGCKADI